MVNATPTSTHIAMSGSVWWVPLTRYRLPLGKSIRWCQPQILRNL